MDSLAAVPQPEAEGPLAFEALLAGLRRQGFRIGIDHHLRLQQLLGRVGAQCLPGELKTLLCPIFATTADQQATFYRLFDACYGLFLPAAPDADKRGSDALAPEPAVVNMPLRGRRWPYFLGAAITLVLIALLAVWISLKTHPNAPATTATEPGPPSNTPATVRDTPYASQPAPAKRPAAPIPAAEPLLDGGRLMPGRIALWFLPLIIYLFYEWYRFTRRRLVLQKQAGRKPPVSWLIRAEVSARSALRSPHFFRAVRRMHSRQVAEMSPVLDVPATIRATVRSLGYPDFRYKAGSRVPEYLLLVDQASARDHQARLFEDLAATLRDEGLFVETYFFDRDPRVCSAENGDRVFLVDLQRKYAGHRLLLFGEADSLVDPVTGRLAGWTELFRGWTDRAVLTPEPPARWGLREKTLAALFVVLPAGIRGLLALMDHFEAAVPGETGRGKEPEAALAPIDIEAGQPVDSLRDYLGADAFAWLCACAVYPELHWSLTLQLAELPCLGEGLLTEENLIRLVRLPWFRTGSIPADLRVRLMRELDNVQETAIRKAIVDVIERNPAPEGTHAADRQQLEIVLQHMWLERKSSMRLRKLRKALSDYPDSDTGRGYTELRLEDSARTSLVDFLLPSRLRKVLFRHGIPSLGLATAARILTVTAAIVLASIGISHFWQQKNESSRLRATAEDVFYRMRELQAALVRDRESVGTEEFARRRAELIRVRRAYYGFVKSIGLYEGKTPVQQAIMRLARNLGETDLDVPPDFVQTTLKYVEKWRSPPRLRTALNTARQRNLPRIIRTALDQYGLPSELLLIPLQESGYDSSRVGPATRAGIAKGLWQLTPGLAVQFHLTLGPLKDEPRVDSLDQRHDDLISTQAAVRYLAELYANKAAGSALLAAAAYNYGQTRMVSRLDRLPNDPRHRNLWKFWRDGWIPEETKEYVMSFFSAALVCEYPDLFGFSPEPILSELSIGDEDYYDISIDRLRRIRPESPGYSSASALLAEAEKQKKQQDISLLMMDAQNLRSQGQAPEARQTLQKILELEPGNEPALAMIAELDVADVAAKSAPQQEAEIRKWLGNAAALVDAGRLTEANTLVDKVERLRRPDTPELASLRRQIADRMAQAALGREAEALFRQGKYTDAQKAVGRWLAAEPASGPAQTLKNQIAEAAAALKAYEAASASHRYDDALAAAARLAKANPSDPAAVGLRKRTEMLRGGGGATFSVFRLGEPASLLLDDQPIGIGDIENRPIPPGRHKITLVTSRGRQTSLSRDFVDGENIALVYDAAKSELRAMIPADRDLVGRKPFREIVVRYPVEHPHGLLRGTCKGELRISGVVVEYQGSDPGHSFSIPFQSLKLTVRDDTLELMDVHNEKYTFRVAGRDVATSIKQRWDKLAQLAK